MGQNWYQGWFDSAYYHLLYKERDEKEAENFIKNICKKARLAKGSKILDLACGRGRHSICLSNAGYQVTGLDLSPNNIDFAKEFENAGLEFYVHDMRNTFRINYFDAVFNLFTSFGYFETDQDDLKVLGAAWQNLKNGGILVLDYFNKNEIVKSLIKDEIKIIDGIEFHISRFVDDNQLIKKIEINDGGEIKNYFEKVKLIDEDMFDSFFKGTGFNIFKKYGDYELSPFTSQSKRLIIFAEKLNY